MTKASRKSTNSLNIFLLNPQVVCKSFEINIEISNTNSHLIFHETLQIAIIYRAKRRSSYRRYSEICTENCRSKTKMKILKNFSLLLLLYHCSLENKYTIFSFFFQNLEGIYCTKGLACPNKSSSGILNLDLPVVELSTNSLENEVFCLFRIT